MLKDINEIPVVISKLIDEPIEDVSPTLVAYLQYLIRSMPQSNHEIFLRYRYIAERHPHGHVPYTSLTDDHALSATNFQNVKVYLDKFEALGLILSQGCDIVYLNPDKFGKYRFLIDAFSKEYRIPIEWSVPQLMVCRYILSDADYEGYARISPHVLERLDEKTDPLLLVKHFNSVENITKITIPMLQKVVIHWSLCGNPKLGSIAANYAISYAIDDELVVSCCYVILYYDVSPAQASNYVLNWLQTSKSIQGRTLNSNLWLTNWKYYSPELQQLIIARIVKDS